MEQMASYPRPSSRRARYTRHHDVTVSGILSSDPEDQIPFARRTERSDQRSFCRSSALWVDQTPPLPRLQTGVAVHRRGQMDAFAHAALMLEVAPVGRPAIIGTSSQRRAKCYSLFTPAAEARPAFHIAPYAGASGSFSKYAMRRYGPDIKGDDSIKSALDRLQAIGTL